MQVSVEQLEGLERRMTVTVPAEKIDREVETRLKKMLPKIRIDGFRPGKVPFKVVRRMYGPQVRQEVMGETLEQSFQDALSQEKLRPAHPPRIEPGPESTDDSDGFSYCATFEVFPDFEVQGIEGFSVNRPVAEVTEADIDNMLQDLRKQRIQWKSAERASQQGDRLTLDFEGSIDGEVFPGGTGEGTQVVLGEGRMLAAFEENLAGLGTDDEKTFEITFPEDYQATHLAGKTASFSVKVTAVEEPELPEINDEFAASFEVDDPTVEGLRNALRQTMERELQEGIKANIKSQVMDHLVNANPELMVPQAMVKEEIDSLARQAGVMGKEKDQPDTPEIAELKQKMFAEQARRRVSLGLLVSRVVDANQIQLEPARVQDRLEAAVSSGYAGMDPETLMRMYRENPQAMESIRAMALEEQVVDWLLERATIVDEPRSFDDIMKPKHHHDHDHDHGDGAAGE